MRGHTPQAPLPQMPPPGGGPDGLIGIAHHAHVSMLLAKQHHELVLHAVGVLILIDEHMSKALLVRGQHLWLCSQ